MNRSEGWEHFDHVADIGVRGYGNGLASAFEQAGLALTSVVTRLDAVRESESIDIECEAVDAETLFVDWLNALVFEMAVRKMLFRRYEVTIDGNRLSAKAFGERVNARRHRPAVEVKGATYTALSVSRLPNGSWVAQTVVDV